jgi:hypothetical protein
MTNAKKLAILTAEVAQLSATLRQLQYHAHIVFWQHGAKLVKEGKSKEWQDLGESLKLAEGIMQTTRLQKK